MYPSGSTNLLNVGAPENFEELRKIQISVSSRVSTEDVFHPGPTAGFDIAYEAERMFCGAAVVDYESMDILELRSLTLRERFPYVPTFLGFREAPAILRLLTALKVAPRILIVNGHGTAHPSRAGLACFVGVENPDLATIGVAQRRLCGAPQDELSEAGSWSFLEYRGRCVGAVLLTVPGGKPIFVSPGHNISIETSVEIVKHFVTDFRLPLPLKLAHEVAERERGKYRSKHRALASE